MDFPILSVLILLPAAAAVVVALIPERRREVILPVGVALSILPVGLAGYLFFDRAFAHLHIPGTPVFVAEPVLALGLVAFYTVWGFRQAAANDRIVRAQGRLDPPDKLSVWPFLVRTEFIAAIVVMLIFTVWSIVLDSSRPH